MTTAPATLSPSPTPPAPTAPAPTPTMAVVACIEAGPLEPMTVRMVESLRRWGGRVADAEVFAVNARRGPPLSAHTRRRLDALGVRLVTARQRHRYVWQHLLHKLHSLIAVEPLTTADTITWLDSDLVILREPTGMILAPGDDFTAMPSMGILGSQGPHDSNDPFWQRAAARLGLRADDLPWVITAEESARIRMYINSGVMTWRRTLRLSQDLLDDCESLLDGLVPRRHIEAHLIEQASIGLTVVRRGLRWRVLTHPNNFNLTSRQPDLIQPHVLKDLRIMHYHDAMEPHTWARLMAALRPSHPHVHDWLESEGPVTDPTRGVWRGVREAFRLCRGVQRRLYYSRAGFRKE